MESLQIINYIAVIVTAVVAIAALVSNWVIERRKNFAGPFLRRLYYINNPGIYLCNYGMGALIIIDVTCSYNQSVASSPIELISSDAALRETFEDIIWSTFLDRSDLIGRTILKGGELKLIEFVGDLEENVLSVLTEFIKNVKITLRYKDVYGKKGCIPF